MKQPKLISCEKEVKTNREHVISCSSVMVLLGFRLTQHM